MSIAELGNNIHSTLKYFKDKTNAIVCSVIDKDGFILATEKEDYIDEMSYNKKMIALYTNIESLNLIKFREKTEIISFSEIENRDFGSIILIRAIRDIGVLIAVFPAMPNIDFIINEFNEVIEKLSSYFKP